MNTVHIVGARPNFIRVAPVMPALRSNPTAFDQVLIHGCLHCDFAMSQVFFQNLALPEPWDGRAAGRIATVPGNLA